MKKIYLADELNKYTEKISSCQNFTLMRYGDGERSLMTGRKVKAQEGWTAPEEITDLGYALKETLNLQADNVFYGISCPCCDSASYYWYRSNIASNNITFANLFVNTNYYRFLDEFEKIHREAVIIGNYAGIGRKIGNLDVIDYFPVGDQCVEFWEKEAKQLIEQIKEKYGNRKDLLYVFSAGPLSEPIIYELYNNNPENCYIDFGSSLDIYIHQKDTRPYSDRNSVFGSRNCWMHDPTESSFDVSVVLTTYKKPDALKKQISAIQKQTLVPKEIMLYQDGIEDGYKIVFDKKTISCFDNVYVSEKNTGVWERFRFAKKAKNTYVCIFDDDTIPGERWLENCLSCMFEQEGVYGTVGIVLKDYKKYPYGGFYRVGWHRPYTKMAEVDFVGHSWFIKRDYLEYMFENCDDYISYKYCGEDMHLSFACQKHGIKTFVPPHPYYDKEMWGSKPDTGMKYGNASTAISQNVDNCMKMREALRKMIDKGWIIYNDRENNKVKYNDRNIKYEKIKSDTKDFYLRVRKKIRKIGNV